MNQEEYLENLKLWKQYAPAKSVAGAYVGEPVPGLYGLKENEILMSVDARSLYPVSQLLGNIAYESLYGRLYDKDSIDNIIILLEKVFESKRNNKFMMLRDKIIDAFNNAVDILLREYFKRKSPQNKGDFRKGVKTGLSTLFSKIIEYNGDLNDIFSPINDKTYYLNKMYLFPLLESISWLSPKNRGYNNIILDRMYSTDEEFLKKYKDYKFKVFTDINSTKVKFKILDINEIQEIIFNNFVLNPFGTLFLKHEDYLPYESKLIISGLEERALVKNEMLALYGIYYGAKNIKDTDIMNEILSKKNVFKLSKEEVFPLYKILDKTEDENDLSFRFESIKNFEFNPENYHDFDTFIKYIGVVASQRNNMQNAIKVTLNSQYGLYGLISFQYSSSLIANSITNMGKIVGIKTFQNIADHVIKRYEKGWKNGS